LVLFVCFVIKFSILSFNSMKKYFNYVLIYIGLLQWIGSDILFAQKISVKKIVLNIGSNDRWKEYDFDDSDWGRIKVPSPWENEGLSDYDGFAWYRVHFDASTIDPTSWYSLNIGRLDDVDITYLNGIEIGRTGSFPPIYKTAYHIFREYIISGSTLLQQDNLLAIKVYDDRLLGGWLEGELEIQTVEPSNQVVLPLLGFWKFKEGDNSTWKSQYFNDSNWDSVKAGMPWEYQTSPDYDGYAWYRKKIILPKSIEIAEYELNLGYIDDADQVFINGFFIGETGEFSDSGVKYPDLNYQKLRKYKIPKSLMESQAEWLIAVRVFDGLQEGGMVRGHQYIQKNKFSKNTDPWFQSIGNFVKLIFKAVLKSLKFLSLLL